MKESYKIAFVYTLLHFFVDFTTIFLVCKVLTGPIVGLANHSFVFIIYNLVAFAGQLPIGILSDFLQKNRFVAAVGCALSGIAFPLSFVFPWLACFIGALGNGAFHIGAGADILKMSMPKAGLSGTFVSSGALGVWLAYKASGTFFLFFCPFVMFLATTYLLLSKNLGSDRKFAKIYFTNPKSLVITAVLCFSLTIIIRSFLGMVMSFSWKAVPYLSLLSVLAVFGGKALGGILGDKLGYTKTAVLSLGMSFIAFLFAFDLPIAGIFAILCFNMTMPLTLTAIAGLCRQKYGFAFGLTTFALALGFIPVVFGAGNFFGMPMLLLCVGLSLFLLVFGYLLLDKIQGVAKK